MKSSSNSRNIFLILIAGATLGTGYFAFKQYNERKGLEEKMEIEGNELRKHMSDVFTRIETNLSEIIAHEGILRAELAGEHPESSLPVESRIQNEISVIADLMRQNEKLIDDLNAAVGDRDKKLNTYRAKVRDLNKRMEKYTEEAKMLSQLNASLSDSLNQARMHNEAVRNRLLEKETEINNQVKIIDMQRDEIAVKENKIASVSYIVDTYQRLREAAVLEKDGGIAGIGATMKLRNGFDKKHFTVVNMYDYTIIPIFSNKAVLVTSHDVNTYELVKDNDIIKWIKINNPEKFWEDSHYLVVVIDNKEDASASTELQNTNISNK